MFPFKLRFAAHSDVKGLFSAKSSSTYLEQLKSIAPDSVLYDVYALDDPVDLDGQEELIGHITLKSNLVTSSWGDKHLFFRH